MAHYIDKDALVADIERRIKSLHQVNSPREQAVLYECKDILSFLDTLEVKESKLPNPRFPHLNNIVDKVFGAGNLESWEYEEAEQLVLLAKEELLKDLEVKEVDLQKEIDKEWEKCKPIDEGMGVESAFIHIEAFDMIAKHFFELGLKTKQG